VYRLENLLTAARRVIANRGAAGIDHIDNVYVVDADLKSYFDTIPHANLMARVKEHVSDSRILRWIEMFLKQGIMEDLAVWTPETGTPQGAVLSPLLANIYLNPLDHMLSDSGYELVRYADDFVILCRSEAEANQALSLVQKWVAEHGLTLHPTKTRIADADQQDGFQFLGYWFKKGRIRDPRPKSRAKLRTTLRMRTRRNRGDSLPVIIADVNSVLRGWFAYFRHCFWNVFTDLDSWVHRRLRSILRRRCKRRGISKGRDHVRWPDRFFADHGLFSLHTAHVQLSESSSR
jgi:RNA-directed DNA polymerase